MKYKVGICGYYAEGIKDYGGQPVKTRILIKELTNIFGIDMVKTVDTLNWKKRIIKLVFECLNLSRTCENIIILPAVNGVKGFVPMFLFLNFIFHRRLHYVVIGGWLTSILADNKKLCRQLKKFDGIYVETNVMETELKKLGFVNIYYMPNMKRLEPVSLLEIDKEKDNDLKFRFCFFSRVVKEKGIEDAINAVIQINREVGKVRCKLDIYGHVYENYKKEFESILTDAPNYIVYKGVTKPNESVQTLKDYYMQLFPTKYKTEGVPGSIIDSYFAGLPVLASKWESFDDVIDEGKTGIGFEFSKYEDLIEKMKWAINNPDEVYRMKHKCIKKAMEYTPERVIGEFITHL